jgi:hypothetical protein
VAADLTEPCNTQKPKGGDSCWGHVAKNDLCFDRKSLGTCQGLIGGGDVTEAQFTGNWQCSDPNPSNPRDDCVVVQMSCVPQHICVWNGRAGTCSPNKDIPFKIQGMSGFYKAPKAMKREGCTFPGT